MTTAFRAATLACTLGFSLGACASAPASDDGGAAAQSTAGCDADAARSVIGQQATPEVLEQARTAAGAQDVRTLAPGQVVTMEYREGRLNVEVDEANVVTAVRCG